MLSRDIRIAVQRAENNSAAFVKSNGIDDEQVKSVTIRLVKDSETGEVFIVAGKLSTGLVPVVSNQEIPEQDKFPGAD